MYVKKSDDKFERQPIQIGVADFDFAEVTKGLKGGEVVSLVTPAGEGSAAQTTGGEGGKASANATTGSK